MLSYSVKNKIHKASSPSAGTAVLPGAPGAPQTQIGPHSFRDKLCYHFFEHIKNQIRQRTEKKQNKRKRINLRILQNTEYFITYLQLL